MAGCITISGSGGTANATLAGLTDVHFAIHPTSGQALVYDGVNSRWTNGRPAWTLPDWASTHIYEPGDTVYHQGQFWRNIQTAGANTGHEPKLLKAEAIGWFRRGGHTVGPLYPEFVEIGDTFLAPTGTIATHFGAHYAVKYHSDTNWTVWEWKVISHGPPITFGWHKIDIAHKVTHRHYAEPSPVTAEETGLLWIFDAPGSTSTPIVPQRYWEPVVLGDYLVSLADVDASKAVAGDTLVLDANGRWVATPVGTTPGGGGGNYQPILPKTQYGANLPLNANLGWTSTISGEVATEADRVYAAGVGVSSNSMFTQGMYFTQGSGMYLSGGSIETNSATSDTRIQRQSLENGTITNDSAVILKPGEMKIYATRKLASGNVNAEFFLQTDRTFDVNTPAEAKGTYNGTAVKLAGAGSIFSERLVRGDNSHQISMAANATHSMVQLIHNKPIVKTDDTIATLKDIADATSGGGGGGLDIATANGLYLPSLQTANTPLSTVTNLQRSFGVIGASNSGAIGLSNTTAQIRLVNKSNTDERLATTCLTLSGITDTVTGTSNLSASSAITSLAKTTRVNEGSLAKTTEAISATGVTLTLKASSTPNASNGTGDASYTVLGGSVEFISNSGNGFRYRADHGLTAIAGNTNTTIIDDSYIVRKYADTRYLQAPAAATANQVLTYNGTAWGAANASSGGGTVDLSGYIPRSNVTSAFYGAPAVAMSNGTNVVGVYSDGTAGVFNGLNEIALTPAGPSHMIAESADGAMKSKLQVTISAITLESKDLTKSGAIGVNSQGVTAFQPAGIVVVGDTVITGGLGDARYIQKPAAATANQVLTYDGTTWGAANATGGDLSLYVPRTSNAPLVIETTKQTSMQVGMTLVSKYGQYSSSLAIDGSKGFTLQDMRGSTVKSSTSGEVLIIPDTIQSPSPTKIRVLVGQVDIPVGPSGASDPTGGITIQQGEPIKALVAPANSTFSDPLAYITSGYANATFRRNDAPGYTGTYTLPDGKVMTIQNGVIVSIA